MIFFFPDLSKYFCCCFFIFQQS